MSILDSAISVMSNAWDTVSGTATMAWENVTEEWKQQVENVKTKAKEFAAIYNELVNQEEFVKKYPELQSEYDSLMSKGDIIRATVEKITKAIDWGAGLFNGGMNGRQLNGMGALPLIPIAALAGAVTAMTYFISDAYKMKAKIETIKEMEAKGYNPSQIANDMERIDRSASAGIFSKLFSVSGVVLIGVGTYMFWPVIKSTVKKLSK